MAESGTDRNNAVEVHEIRDGDLLAREFHQFPRLLHEPGHGTSDARTERALLAGRHPLSPYLQIRAFLACRAGRPVGRVALSVPRVAARHVSRDRTAAPAYAGFFECEDDQQTAGLLLETVAAAAREAGATELVGPVDGSFWLRYRMKVSGFDQAPYFGEPLNPPYYSRLWQDAGFQVCDEYVSHYYADIPADTPFDDFERKLAEFEAAGYSFEHPHRRTWNRDLTDLHELLSALYTEFPTFHPLPWPAFQKLFNPLKWAMDPKMVVIVRCQGEPVAFRVALPDYGIGLDSGNPLNRLVTLVRRRRQAARYVQIYSGVRPGHRGLGFAMNVSFTRAVLGRGARAVGALMHRGNATTRYGAEHIESETVHVLLRREL